MKGSVTVEASYVFPFVFVMIGIVFCLGIFLFNQSVLKMTGYECIINTMEEWKESDDYFRENLLRKLEETVPVRTISIKDLEMTVNVTISKVQIIYKGTQTMLDIPFEVIVTYEKTFPELTLRLNRIRTGV